MPARLPTDLQRELIAALLPWLGDSRGEIRLSLSAATASRVPWGDGIAAQQLGGHIAAHASIADWLAVLRDVRGLDATPETVAGIDRLVERVTACLPAPAGASSDPETAFHEAVLRLRAGKSQHIDKRFVRLTVLRDLGPEAMGTRFVMPSNASAYTDLRDLLKVVTDPCLVMLGAPGGGKSTLLYRLHYDTALDALNGKSQQLAWVVPLNAYPGDARDPRAWLATRWETANPLMPRFETVLAQGRLLLLLDALNELKRTGADDLAARIDQWRDFLKELADTGNQAVVTCRSLDYSLPLSNQGVATQQATVQPLSANQVREFLRVYLPEAQAEAIWARLRVDRAQLDLYSSPYFLKLLTELIRNHPQGQIPTGRAALFTGFVRAALRRELDARHPALISGTLLSPEDRTQITNNRYSRFQLPDRGALVPALERLADGMQRAGLRGESAQVRVSRTEALALISSPYAEQVLAAAVAINVLDLRPEEDDAVLFVHQLLQEYFAARAFAAAPDVSLVASSWQAGTLTPSLDEIRARQGRYEPLPSPPATGWEETVRMAVAMSGNPDRLVRAVADLNLPLAGRAAAAEEDAPVSVPVKTDLREALLARMQDTSADLRARIAAGEALGELGDPRFTRGADPDGHTYLLPPLIDIPAGKYPLGDDASEHEDEKPAHTVELGAFSISKFPVTNAEYACFIAAGGYQDERWWDTDAAKAWRLGRIDDDLASKMARYRMMSTDELSNVIDDDTLLALQVFTGNPSTDRLVLITKVFEQWFEKRAEPANWADLRYSTPNHPVVGVSWFEARAYCAWLSAQTGQTFRLMTEAEFEAAARGRAGRAYPFGVSFDSELCNTKESAINRTTTVGLYRDGESHEGVADLAGNVSEWTGSRYIPYPYEPTQNREDPSVDDERVLRGGSWGSSQTFARAACRDSYVPSRPGSYLGFRVVRAPVPPPR